MDRRNFLRLPLLSAPMFFARDLFGQQREKPSDLKVKTPVIVSTWDSGISANNAAWPLLQKGGRALDAVEAAGRASEDEPSCCVGLQAWPDRDGRVTLDSCIMNGNGDIGAVSFLERIKHPVSVARKVMETTPHVLLSGEGAQAFAVANGFPLEDGRLSPDAEKEWKKWLEKSKYQPVINIENRKDELEPPLAVFSLPPYRFDDGSFNHDTMGTVAMDAGGKLAGMVTTSGMAFKIRGRVGDSPIIGAGLFVDNEVGRRNKLGRRRRGDPHLRNAYRHRTDADGPLARRSMPRGGRPRCKTRSCEGERNAGRVSGAFDKRARSGHFRWSRGLHFP